MAWRPRLNIVCNRCGKPRELGIHHCVSNSSRSASLKLKPSFGTCGKCGKKYEGNPLTHVCVIKSDFKKRKTAAGRAAARKKRQSERHDYQACGDKECPRPLCVAFKTGWNLGHEEGYDDGYIEGYASGYGAGYSAGMASVSSGVG